jgi:riboflavin kinase/FMN adenylyltransferase
MNTTSNLSAFVVAQAVFPSMNAIGWSRLLSFGDLDQPPVRVSSSNIRTALAQGEIDLANSLLGRPYNLLGRVVQGKQLGRTIGFPTANLEMPTQKCLPRDGVYAVQAMINNPDPAIQSPSQIFGVMNIGLRPTVDGDQRSVEVHLFDWQGDLYNQELSADLIRFIRPERKFDSLDALKAQIQADCQTVRNYLAPNQQILAKALHSSVG